MLRHIIPKILAACSLILNLCAVVVFVRWLAELDIRSGSEYSYSVAHRGPPAWLIAALVLSILGVVSTIAYLVLSGRAGRQPRSQWPRVLASMAALGLALPAIIIIPASIWQLPAAQQAARREAAMPYRKVAIPNREAAIQNEAAKIPDKSEIKKFLRDLDNDDYMVRHGAAKDLASAPSLPESAIPKLLEVAARNEGEISIYAVDALRHFPDHTSEVVPGLVTLLDKRELGLRAGEALGVYGKPGVDALLTASKSTKWRARESAAHGLGSATYFEQGIIVRLTELLRDEDASVRSASAISLYGFGVKSESALPVLESMANDSDPKARSEAERTAYEIKRQLGSRNQ